jgi:hypothetical protein
MGFYVMRYGAGRYTSVAWFPTQGQATAEVERMMSCGEWFGMPPKVEPDERTRPEMEKQAFLKSAELRRKIRMALRSTGCEMILAEVGQCLPEERLSDIQKELHVLCHHPTSDIYWNGARGAASKYGVGIKMVETVEE